MKKVAEIQIVFTNVLSDEDFDKSNFGDTEPSPDYRGGDGYYTDRVREIYETIKACAYKKPATIDFQIWDRQNDGAFATAKNVYADLLRNKFLSLGYEVTEEETNNGTLCYWLD